MISKTDTLFSRMLVDKGLMSPAAIQPYLDEAAKSKEGLMALLTKRAALPEEVLLKNLSECMKVPFVELNQLLTQKEVILDEGLYHQGPAAVIQLKAQK